MKIAVLGAGLAGVTTAWFLAKDGHEVVVLDREAEVAAVASRANGGIVASSRAFPWPSPRMQSTILRALFRNDQAVRLRLQLDPHFWRWGLHFLACCTEQAFARLLERKVRLVRYSQDQLAALVEATGVAYGRLTNGVLYLYRSPQELEAGVKRLALMDGQGFRTRVLDAAQAARVEPALGASRDRLAGAIHAESDEAGDSAAFCRALARLGERQGVAYRMEHAILGIEAAGDRATAVLTSRGRVAADAFVCALGVIEPGLRGAFGVGLPVYPVRGYSLTAALGDAAAAPVHAGIDESRLVAFCPMQGALRLTGGAEFAGYGREGEEREFRRLYDVANELFPGAVRYKGASKWVCQRPMTPDSLPRFGTARYRNLWFNIGQGHMGWAMAPGSGRIVADLVAGRRTAIDLDGLRIA